MHSRRLVLLLTSGLVILGLVIFRERQLEEWKRSPPPVKASPRILAPRFQVADHRRQIVKFERFLGRQRVVLLFFDAELGADRDPHLRSLIDAFDALKANGIEVIAISDATPFANLEAEKRLGREIPFPLLTDIDLKSPMTSPVHRQYGMYDAKNDKSLTGLFLIARDGTIPVGFDGRPRPVQDVDAAMKELSQGRWPE